MMLIPAIMIPVFGQEPFLTVNVGQERYEEGDTVIISGKVDTVIPGSPIIMQTVFGDKNIAIVNVGQVKPAQDGSFTHTILAQGPKWQNEGQYTVRVTYGSGNVAEQKFEFSLKKDAVQTRENFEVGVPDSVSTIDIGYAIEGATMVDMYIEQERFSIVAIINPTQDGTLAMDLPRDAIDARANGCQGDESDYIVLVDDIQNGYTESGNDRIRTISVGFGGANEKIEVIGTCVVPEFGTIIITMVAAMIVMMVVGRVGVKSRIFA